MRKLLPPVTRRGRNDGADGCVAPQVEGAVIKFSRSHMLAAALAAAAVRSVSPIALAAPQATAPPLVPAAPPAIKNVTTPSLTLVPRLQNVRRRPVSTLPYVAVANPSTVAGLTGAVRLTIPVRISGFSTNALGQRPAVWIGCALSATPIAAQPLEPDQHAISGGFAPAPAANSATNELLDSQYRPIELDANLAYAGNVSLLLGAPTAARARSAAYIACRLFELTSSFHTFSNAPVAGAAPWSTFEPYFEAKL